MPDETSDDGRAAPVKTRPRAGASGAKPAAKGAAKAGARTGSKTGAPRQAPRPAKAAGAAHKTAKPRLVVAAPAEEATLPVKGGTLRKKELVERVVAASGAKKKAVREIVEATLKVLGDALAADESLALPPFGKARVNKHKGLASGEMLVVKLRRAGAAQPGAKGGTESLADVAD